MRRNRTRASRPASEGEIRLKRPRLAELDALRLAPDMTVPLHVTSDREDRETPLPSVEKLVRSWPGATLRVTEGLGHRRILRDPEVVDEAVRYFSREASPQAVAV